MQVDGKPAGALQVAPDSFTTLVARRDGGKVTLARIDDSGGAQDALKAELRFYNLIPGCAGAALKVSPQGPTLFDDIKPQTAAARHQSRAGFAGRRLRLPPAPSWRCPRYSPAIITACSSAAPPPCRR